MDEIRDLIKKLADKVQSDDEIKELFKKEPVKAVEKILGVDLPDDLVNKIIDGVKYILIRADDSVEVNGVRIAINK